MKGLILVFLSILAALVTGDSMRVDNVDITTVNQGARTVFTITSSLAPGVNPHNVWLGIGFNSQMIYLKNKSPANAVICKSRPTVSTVEQYHNHDKMSHPLVPTNPSIGISNPRIGVINGKLVCSFTRDNINPTPGYFNINTKTISNVIVAFGPFTSNGEIAYHGANRAVSSRALNFAS